VDCRTYLLAFDSADHAKRFVVRLILNIPRNVSAFRDGEHVRVFDGTPSGALRRIVELAKTSSARSIKAASV